MSKTFRKFEKIARLSTQETDGLLDGMVWFFPKLDGTNASMWWDYQNKSIAYGSRNRQLSADDDNAGFMNWGLTQTKYSDFMVKHQGRYRLYGEWLVPHTIKDYKEDAWRDFYIYDVWDEKEERYLAIDEYGPMLKEADLTMIPAHGIGNPTAANIEDMLKIQSTFKMKEGCKGEGIVLKNYGFTNRFGECKYGKYLNDGFMDKPKKTISDNQVETDLAELMIDKTMVDKTAAKVKVSRDTEFWDRKTMIPHMLEIVHHDCYTEKLYDAVKKMKMPAIHHGKLRGAIVAQIKKVGREYF